MNIFALDQCPMQSALWLDDIRKNKMILESAQMLSTAVRLLIGTPVEVKVKHGTSVRTKQHWLLPDEDINEVIEKNLKYGKNYERIFFDNFEKLCDFVSKFLAEKKIVGWYQDAMEWGPRSLGNRSILADPRLSLIHI